MTIGGRVATAPAVRLASKRTYSPAPCPLPSRPWEPAMRRSLALLRFTILLVGFLASFGVDGAMRAARTTITLGPDSQRQEGVPRGTVTQHHWKSKIFDGTERDYWVYVPSQYKAENPACVMVFQDGKWYVGRGARLPRADRVRQFDSQGRDACHDWHLHQPWRVSRPRPRTARRNRIAASSTTR